jgi:hypothetical protein
LNPQWQKGQPESPPLPNVFGYTINYMQVFSDRDLSGSTQQKERVAQALSRADALFASLLFDYDQVRSNPFV